MGIKPPSPDDDGFLAGPISQWEPDFGYPGLLEYGSDRTYGKSQTSLPGHTKAGSYIHKVKLEGLDTETVYYYRVTTNGSATADARFRTAPAADTPFRFIVWGDSHHGVAVFQTLVGRMADYSPDLLLSVGDLVQRGSDYPQWRDQYFDPIRETANRIPVCGVYRVRNNACSPENQSSSSFVLDCAAVSRTRTKDEDDMFLPAKTGSATISRNPNS